MELTKEQITALEDLLNLYNEVLDLDFDDCFAGKFNYKILNVPAIKKLFPKESVVITNVDPNAFPIDSDKAFENWINNNFKWYIEDEAELIGKTEKEMEEFLKELKNNQNAQYDYYEEMWEVTGIMLNNWVSNIESFFKIIDDEYGTKYAPTGWKRVFVINRL